MTKIEEAQMILHELGLPQAQQNEISAYTILALCGIKPQDEWKNATRISLSVTKGIMSFVLRVYEKDYAPNTRETFRRKVLHQFVQARIADYNPDNPKLPVNSPNAHYAMTPEALAVVQTFNTRAWRQSVETFKAKVGELGKKYRKERKQTLIPVKLSNGKTLRLSSGNHNELQAAIINDFAVRFAKGATVIYFGDTANKDLYFDKPRLKLLGVTIDQHNKLPDVVLYDAKRKWLFLVEAVTSHGPISPKRLVEMEEFLQKCNVGKVYVTAFPDFKEFKKHSNNIAWETEVWLADSPDHLIHFNGDRFFGPR